MIDVRVQYKIKVQRDALSDNLALHSLSLFDTVESSSSVTYMVKVSPLDSGIWPKVHIEYVVYSLP